MKVFYDTEFLEDGKTIELISIGMVAEDGRELYLVNEEIERNPLNDRICSHHWLMENVIPHLPLNRRTSTKPYTLPQASNRPGHFLLDSTDNRVVSRRYIRNAVRDFVLATPDVELWAWYGAYDHVALAQLFGRMIDLPKGVPMWTNDLKQECQRLGNPPMPEQPDGVHNALADARHVATMAAYLETLAHPVQSVTGAQDGQAQ